MRRLIIILLLSILSVRQSVSAPKEKPEFCVPMDYSSCGYHASELDIPDVASTVYVPSTTSDCYERIQNAIDHVASLTANKAGHRGAVLLGEGTYRLSRSLRITHSGVVIRGVGRDKTILLKEGVERDAAVYIEGHRDITLGAHTAIAATKVPAGATALPLASTRAFKVGQRVHITRPCTDEWIDHLQMRDFGGGLDYTGWKKGDLDIVWDRYVEAIRDDTLIIDAPITTTLSDEYGGASVAAINLRGEVTESGIENLTIKSATNSWNTKDEDHCWVGVYIDNARDCWVRRVGFDSLSGSAVALHKHTIRITVEDCVADNPVSEIGGWRRNVFFTRGQQTLFQRCISRCGIHDFVAGYCAAGPNAFVQCEGEMSLGFSGSVGSWAAGLLFDIVNIDGHDIRLGNLEQFQFGTGWNSANAMVWQSTASTIWCYSPDADNRCSAHGCWGTLTGNAQWTSSNEHVRPRSLFYDQLSHRLNEGLRREGHLLPLNTTATSSPTVEQAEDQARLSLSTPRLTLRMWMDSISFTAPTDSEGVPEIDDITRRHKPAQKQSTPQQWTVNNGWLTAIGGVVTGNRHAIPWWSGRTKDNFCAKGAQPAITRFVPCHEGNGWTDRIDSVVSFMTENNFAVLDHNYGLWYDLRRTDHERVRRADGDVWAPFYEQPVARSGQGQAWDGLSRYDLTRPNEWYWSRLRSFANSCGEKDMMLYCQHYFQHNILEAGAHWVDSPWRPTNNINGTTFPEPVPFAGDKRIFMAEQFYNIEGDTLLRSLHRQYIRMCLNQMRGIPNAVHCIGAEYTGPLHFIRFWLQTIAEWEAETDCDILVALSCTKDAQDTVLEDPELSSVVDIIDIRYWHYNTTGLWAPEAGKNMAPRQWMRKMKVGKTGADEVYRAVSEYRCRYPHKAIVYYGQSYEGNGWAALMAGGSLANVKIKDRRLHSIIPHLTPQQTTECFALTGNEGMLLFSRVKNAAFEAPKGRYDVFSIDKKSGDVCQVGRRVKIDGRYELPAQIIFLVKK